MKKLVPLGIGLCLLVTLVASAAPAATLPQIELTATPFMAIPFDGQTPRPCVLYGPEAKILEVGGLGLRLQAGIVGSAEISQWQIVNLNAGPGVGVKLTRDEREMGVGGGWTPSMDRGFFYVNIVF